MFNYSLKSNSHLSDNVYYVNLGIDGVSIVSTGNGLGYLHLSKNNSPKWAL